MLGAGAHDVQAQMMLVVDARRIESTAIIGNGELRQSIISLNRDLDVLRLRVPPRVAQRLAHNVLGLRLRHPRHRQHENERLNVLQHGQTGLHARFIRGHDRIKVNKESCGGVLQFARLRRSPLAAPQHGPIGGGFVELGAQANIRWGR